MAQIGLLLGLKNGTRELIDQGDPRDMRLRFKSTNSLDDFDGLEVFESTVGRSRRKTFPKAQPAPAIDEIVIEKSPEQPEIETDDETAEAIAELIETAQGDARKKDVKEARERLDALGIEY